jgi:hypothetical protein
MSLYDMMNARVHARKPDKIGGMMDARVGDVSIESPQQKSQSVMTAPAMQNAGMYNTVPTATEEKAPAPKTYAVKDSEAIASVAVPVQEAPQAVQSTETPQKKSYTHWWQTPEYLGEVERRAADAEKRAEQDRKRAVRQRNAAILGDLAKLGAQMYAKAGGATRVDQFTPATEKANDKLAALRERHAAEVAAFAKERAAARQAQIADNNARMKLETSLAEADLDRKIKAKKDARDFAYKVGKDEFDAKIAEQNAVSRRISANAAAKNAAEKKKSDATYEEYYKWLEKYPEIKVQRPVAKRDALGLYVKKKDGTQDYEYVDNENPSLREVENAIAKAKDLERRGVKGATSGENLGGWDDSGINEELIDEDFK